MFGLNFKSRAAKPNLVSETGLDGNALFEAGICELHDVAARVAALTSAVNAVANGRSQRILRSCRNFIPTERTSLSVTISLQDANSPEYLVGRYLRSLFGEIEIARGLLELLLREAEQRFKLQDLKRGTQTCAKAWNGASVVALKAVNALEPETRWRLSGLFSENSLVLARLLRSAIKGESPCVDDMDCVTLPPLPQKRRLPRFALQQNCTIVHRGSTYPAFAKDVSAGGLGLTGAPAIPLKAEIEIVLRSGRRFSGQVVWCGEATLGMRFAVPLSPNDPLINI